MDLILYDFQLNTANFIINRLNNKKPILDCSVVGSGKTFISLYCLLKTEKQFLIICPKIVISHWKNHINMYKLDNLCIDVINYEKIKFNKCTYYKDGNWNLPDDTVVIFDEAHKMKGYNTINSKLLLSLNINKYIPYLISATIADNPISFLNVAKMLGYVKNDYSFLYQFGCRKGYDNKGWVFNQDILYLKKLHNIIFNIKDHPGIRITYDMINILNESNNIELMFIDDVYNKIAHLYKLIDDTNILKNIASIDYNFIDLIYQIQQLLINNDEYEKELLENIEEIIVKNETNILVRRLRLKQLIELLKAKLIIKNIIDSFNNGSSIVIMFNYTSSIELLYKILMKNNYKCEIINGNTKNKDEIINNFQTDKLRILIINIKAAGVGISLHDITGKHNRVSFISPSENIYDLQQALGRIYRTGTKTNTIQYIVTIKNTIEENVYYTYIKKLINMNKILDG
jgi:SNF2 family DNA or RNA helicase